MYQQNDQIKIIFVDICSIPAEFDSDWSILTQKVKIIFLATSDIKKREAGLIKAGEIHAFNGFNNPFSVLEDNNIIVKILEKYGLNSNETIIITADYEHLEYFSNYNIKFVHLTKQRYNYKIAPDFICLNVKALEDIIMGKNGGFLAEAVSENNITGKYYYILKNIFEVDGRSFPVWAGGRYFSLGTAQSHYHLLSSKILSNKRDGREYEDFTKIFSKMISLYLTISENFIIVAVPPRPGKSNRFSKLIECLSRNLNIENGLNYLYCNKDYGNNKMRGAYDREKNLAGVFAIQSGIDFTGRDVVIIDDILASGSTIKEMAKVLYMSGVKTVTAFVIGINQLTSQWRNVRYVPLKCLQCHGDMNLKINNRNLIPFYGCENYPTCKYTMNYDEGYRQIKANNILKFIDSGEGFEF